MEFVGGARPILAMPSGRRGLSVAALANLDAHPDLFAAKSFNKPMDRRYLELRHVGLPFVLVSPVLLPAKLGSIDMVFLSIWPSATPTNPRSRPAGASR
jgi:hypothetical protein